MSIPTVSHEPRRARVAAMVADPARSRMLAFMMSGEYASAGELARAASVTPAAASGHPAKLLDARFVICEPRGRHCDYRLADAEVAHALEALALVAERDSHDRAWAHAGHQRLREARCCYGHLAGRLSVLLMDALQAGARLQPVRGGFELTPAGLTWLAGLGLQPDPPSPRWRYAYPCLDWFERRDHLAGQLADQIHQHFSVKGGVRRGSGREVTLTVAGRRDLLPVLQAAASS